MQSPAEWLEHIYNTIANEQHTHTNYRPDDALAAYLGHRCGARTTAHGRVYVCARHSHPDYQSHQAACGTEWTTVHQKKRRLLW